ncbi:MAG: RagB/SusD family nutrient uptake outer membrane protein, partial [Bacteroidales bacterium]
KFAAELPSPTARQLAIQYQGEAKTLRAMAYFYLVRIFGNIPAIYQSYTSDELANLPQSSSKEIYDRIEQDLEDAIKVLPNTQPSQYPGRYNKYTAMALKAKVHLYQNEFDSVANLTNQIIQSGQFFLLSDFRTYFSVLGKNSKESIIEIQSSTLGNTFGDVTFLEYAFQQGPRGNSPSDMQGWGFCVPSQDLINFYQARGEKIRPATTLLYRGTLTPEGDSIKHTCTNPVYNGKAYTPSEYNKWSYNGYGFNQNVRVLRYADVLLMYAEAIVRGASVPDGGKSAESAYAEVRTRAGLGTSGTPSLQDIWDERRAEFAMEEDRFFDLIRTGQAQSVFAKLGITFVPNVNNIFPIPSVQIDLNRNLKQNPGYN